MELVSTRDAKKLVRPAEAIACGLSSDGGLFAPVTLPQLSLNDIISVGNYSELVTSVVAPFLSDFTREELHSFTSLAYKSFPQDAAPVVSLNKNTHILELFHGPTYAFKDFALQLLPHLLTASLKKTGIDKTAVILAATSGDTGSAALEGFSNVVGAKICVFYPQSGISNVQKLQMTTQSAGNSRVIGLKGNFDDAQSGVKRIFADAKLTAHLNEKGYILSSANSINWGRIVPQIAYYFSAYRNLARSKSLTMGDKVNISVPTGNFGNILAAYYAKKCGLPVHKLICASNSNNVLSDFINSGVYDKNRDFHITLSPSMDILISSNLERFLFDMYKCDDGAVNALMSSLTSTGRYEVSAAVLSDMQNSFYAGYANDSDTLASLYEIWHKYGYLSDPHTAVGIKVHEAYVERTGDNTHTIIASTASPFKFADSALLALGATNTTTKAGVVSTENKKLTLNDFEQLMHLSEMSGVSVPSSLMSLSQKQEHHKIVCTPDEMREQILGWLL